MPSEDESVELELSERDAETQFVPEEGDEENLWEVIEIIQEKGKFYRVRWAGVDPGTNKPWAPSWVPRQDCTDDLVFEWKKKQAAKKKGKKGGKGGRGGSVASKRSNGSGGSTVSKAANVSSNNKKRAETSAKTGQKRTHSSAMSETADIESIYASDPETNAHPKKKPKLTRPTEDVYSDGGEDMELPPIEYLLEERPRIRKGSEPARFNTYEDRSKLKHSAATSSKSKAKRKEYRPNSVVHTSQDEEDELAGNGVKSASKGTHSTNGIQQRHQTKPNERRRRSPSSSPPPPPAAKRRITTKEPTLYELSDKEPPKNRSLADLRRPKSKPSHEERLRSLTPTTLNRLARFDEELRSIEQQASGSKPAPRRSPSVEIIPASSPAPPSPAAASLPQPTKRSVIIRNGHDDSYRLEIVPETDLESSNNTQSQSQEIAAPIPVRPGEVPPRQPPDHPQTPDKEDGKKHALRQSNSLIAKMKPRTPSSASRTQSRWSLYDDDDHDSNYHPPSPLYTHPEELPEMPSFEMSRIEDSQPPPKAPEQSPGSDAPHEADQDEEEVVELEPVKIDKAQFQPIPQISPSKFTPYLPTSSISVDNPQDEEAEVQELVSSIEQFSSSDEEGDSGRPRRRRRLLKDKGKGRAAEADEGEVDRRQRNGYVDHPSPAHSDDDEDERSSVLRDRGVELAEEARQERRRNGDAKERNGPLIDLGKIGKKRTKGGYSSEERDEHRMRAAAEMQQSSPPPSQAFDNSRTQEEEEEEVTTPKVKNPALALRQEEEESTQDLLAENDAQLPSPRSSPPPADIDEVDMVDEDAEEFIPASDDEQEPPEDKDQDMVMEQDPDHHDADFVEGDPPSSPVAEKPADKAMSPEVPSSSPMHFASGGKSRSRSASIVSQRPPREQTPERPAATNELVAPAVVTPSHPASLPSHDPSIEMLNLKSKEVARLEALLLAEQAKTSALQSEVESLKEALVNTSVSIPAPNNSEELQALRVQLEQQKLDWEQEKRTLNTSITQLTRGKESAEKDREFFREQYARASGFVSGVRDENKELKQQATISAEQAKTGVALIKVTFEQRVKALEDDVKSWKRLALFVVEKDARTNDDIRRRAAEEPELRARVEDLEDQLASFEEQVGVLQDEIEDRDVQLKACLAENEDWRKEVSMVKEERDEYKARLEELGKCSQDDTSASDELVYRCQWRPEGTNESCNGVFVNAEELQDHLFTSGHLHH